MSTTIEAKYYRAGDVVIVRTEAGKGTTGGIKIGKVRKVLGRGQYRIALRIGNMGMRSGGCKFARLCRTIGHLEVVRLATSREIQIGAWAAFEIMPGVAS